MSGGLKLDLANFRELEAFAAFGAELDKASQDLIDRGRRLVELLKQSNGAPLPVDEQVVSIFAGARGYLDDLAVDRRPPLRGRAARGRARPATPDILDAIRDGGDLPEDELPRR